MECNTLLLHMQEQAPALQNFPASGQGLKSGNNRVVRAIQFLTAGAIYKVGTQRGCVPTGEPMLFLFAA
jgi:hypothetical protein